MMLVARAGLDGLIGFAIRLASLGEGGGDA